jgi:hypothetical protein
VFVPVAKRALRIPTVIYAFLNPIHSDIHACIQGDKQPHHGAVLITFGRHINESPIELRFDEPSFLVTRDHYAGLADIGAARHTNDGVRNRVGVPVLI